MSYFSHPVVLTEAAGVKIVATLPEEDAGSILSGKIILKMQKVNGASDNSCGFHLRKSKWDPYPWVGYVENNSPADLAGLKAGDCLLGVNDTDLLGLRVKDIATLIRSEEDMCEVNFSVWRYFHQKEEQNNIGLALKGPLPDVARNLANALSGIVHALECPICLESAAPPVSQCVHGHILCVFCRPKMTRCPVCRVQLGQGRCLLADKLHRVLRDTFNTSDNETMTNKTITTSHNRHNLRDQLFGKNSKRQGASVVTKNECSTVKPRQFFLTRLLLGNREKAASADNLTRVPAEVSAEEATAISSRATVADSLRVRLTLSDRTKSASTGELSRDSKARIDDSSSRIIESSRELSAMNTSQQSLNLPRMPNWGGSTDSMSYVQLACPFLQSCREVVTFDTLLEHITSHAVPQIHFYSSSAKIPLPFPFGCDALYIFHHGDNVFFFQCEEKMAWMVYPTRMACINNSWEWTLHTLGNDGTEVQLRRDVANLEDPVILSSQHIALLSNASSLKMINVQISEHRTYDKLYI